MMKQGEARSVFAVATYDGGPHFSSLFELKLDGQGGHMAECGEDQEPQSPLLKPVARFIEEKSTIPIVWRFCSLGSVSSCSSTDLCLLPDSGPDLFFCPEIPPLKGYIFNVKNRVVIKSIKPPNAAKGYGHVVSLNGKIYFIVDPYYGSELEAEVPEPSFERYDPNKDSWERLQPFPGTCSWVESTIRGYAICDGFILFNIAATSVCVLWAYDVSGDKWYPVEVENRECYYLRGLAVVADNTIYSLSSRSFSSVLVLSIRREQSDGDLVFTCSLVFQSPKMEAFRWYADQRKDHLVHLGNLEFCLVQSGYFFGCYHFQSIKVTTFRFVGKAKTKINTEPSIFYYVRLQDFWSFDIRLCFSPDCEDIENKMESPMIPLKPEDNEPCDFTFEPECEVIKPGQEEETPMDQQKQEHFRENFVLTTGGSLHLISSPTIPLPPKPISLPSRACEDLESEECDMAIGGGVKVAMEEGKSANLTLPSSAQLVGSAFVEQYYQALCDMPASVYKFYQDSSTLSRTDINGNMTTLKTIDAIKSLNYDVYAVVIKTADAVESFEKGVIVLVTGCLTGKDNVERKFTQTFFLAPLENGYTVLNDIFRYVKDDESSQTNIIDESSQKPDIEEGSVIQSSQNKDLAVVDRTPEVQKSYALIVMEGSVASSPVHGTRVGTISANTDHPSLGCAKPSSVPEESAASGEAALESCNAHEEAEGPFIYVRYLPYDATVEQLEKVFEKFGSVKQDGIYIIHNKQRCFGVVEFESVTSMRSAIKASPITIGDCQAVIEERRSTTPVGTRGRGSFSSGRAAFLNDSFTGRENYGGSHTNEFRNCGEFSRSKSSAGCNTERYQRLKPNGRGGGRHRTTNNSGFDST